MFIGAGLEGNSLQVNQRGAETESGSGLGLVVGYGFTPRWSLYAQSSGAVTQANGGGQYSLAHFDVGARVHFRTGPNVVVPFLQFGLDGRGIAGTFGNRVATGNGAGISLGGGLNAHSNPEWAFSTSLIWSLGDFNTFQVNHVTVGTGSVSATSARVHLGLVWFPGA